MKKFNTLLCAIFFATQIFAQTVSTFENLPLATDTFWDGSDLSGGFNSGNANFANDYDTAFHSWSGFTYSNKKDSTTSGYGNQYAAITASGYNGSANYAIADEYGNANVRLTGAAEGNPVKGFYVTNTTYAYLSMKSGDMFAKKFGGATGTDPDYFRLRVLGWKNGALKQQAVDFFLADFRSADSTQDYIVHDWTWLDLQPLGDVDSILFNLSSSDTAFGYMNTPAYFALDDFTTSDAANVAPVAADDYVTTTYVNDTLINVLANDFDTTFTPLTIELVGLPLIPGAHDTVVGNEILYTPAVGVVAIDTIIYRLCDATQSCVTAKVVVSVTGITVVEELTADGLQFAVYPNPFSGNEIHIITNEKSVGSELTVYDLSGKIMSEERIESQYSIINTQYLANGIYFVKLNSVNGTSVKKIMKQ